MVLNFHHANLKIIEHKEDELLNINDFNELIFIFIKINEIVIDNVYWCWFFLNISFSIGSPNVGWVHF